MRAKMFNLQQKHRNKILISKIFRESYKFHSKQEKWSTAIPGFARTWCRWYFTILLVPPVLHHLTSQSSIQSDQFS